MSNTTHGTGNAIDSQVDDSIAAGNTNKIFKGDTNFIFGESNFLYDGQLMNVFGSYNVITDGRACNIEGVNHKIHSGRGIHVEGSSNTIGNISEPNSLAWGHVQGAGNKLIFNKPGDGRFGADMKGVGGYFKFDPNKTAGTDTYNYSSQLAGGTNQQPLYYGEGISMIDRTILNGIYPLGKHQSYLNTSDGLNYSIMMKSESPIPIGSFVSLSKRKCYKCHKNTNQHIERSLILAKNNCEVIGVVTKSSGFIANAGQFAASERIEYDIYHSPIIKLNDIEEEEEEEVEEEEELTGREKLRYGFLKSIKKINNKFYKPMLLTKTKNEFDRSTPFIPYDERPNYYEVAMMGLVVVNANFKKSDSNCNMCDVEDGIAVPGNKYHIVKFIDENHLMIIMK